MNGRDATQMTVTDCSWKTRQAKIKNMKIDDSTCSRAADWLGLCRKEVPEGLANGISAEESRRKLC